MRCHDVAPILLESSPPGTPEVRAHLEGCEECRTLAAVHASASRLRLPVTPPLPPVTREAVLGEVRRREVRRRVVAGVVASCCVLALTWLTRPEPPVPHVSEDAYVQVHDTAPRSELELRRADTEAEVEPEALAQWGRASLSDLFTEVRGYTRRDAVYRDDLYRPFGAMAAWLRPPDSRALEAPPFRTAIHPISYQESMP
ncbi:hypothetical protein ACN47A_27985 [Myxococcus fulvus]|uniref:hypothetical protein n=1 Tax=Myxococcus fulvus TaxID=33 RepID=UPI003B99D47C